MSYCQKRQYSSHNTNNVTPKTTMLDIHYLDIFTLFMNVLYNSYVKMHEIEVANIQRVNSFKCGPLDRI